MTAVMLLFINFSNAQIKNGNFEVWDTTFSAAYTAELDTVFGVAGATGGTLTSWLTESQGAYGLSRSSESQAGNYSMLLHNWYSYFNEGIHYRDTLSTRPQFLQGYYKYITGGANGSSQGIASVVLTRLSGNGTDTIAKGNYLFDSATAFTGFQLELNYLSASSPDHIDIRFINSNRQCLQGNTCHLLFLDNLLLAGEVTGTGRRSSNQLKSGIFPNPFSSRALLHSGTPLNDADVTIFDVFGRELIKMKNLSGNRIPLNRNNLPDGFYTLIISEGGKYLSSEKMIIEN